MYRLNVYYMGELVTYILCPHMEAIRFIREQIEQEYRNTRVNYTFSVQVQGGKNV